MDSNNEFWVDQGLQLVDTAFRKHAIQCVRFFRNECDSFEIQVEPTENSIPAHRPILEKSDFFEYLPAGSDWDHAIGWRSFFGCEIRFDRLWLVGCVGVRRHETRGAYPEVRLYTVVEKTVLVEALQVVCQTLDPQGKFPNHTFPRGFVQVVSDSPKSHRYWEVNVIRAVIEALGSTNRRLRDFRTLVLSEQEKKNHLSLKAAIGGRAGERTKKIALVVPSILPLQGVSEWARAHFRKVKSKPIEPHPTVSQVHPNELKEKQAEEGKELRQIDKGAPKKDGG